MKKILFALLISLCLLPGVNAETQDVIYSDNFLFSYQNYQITNYDLIMFNFSNKLDSMHNDAFAIYNESFVSDFPYYHSSFIVYSDSESISDASSIWLTFNMYTEEPTYEILNSTPQPKNNSQFHQLMITCSINSSECNTSTNSANAILLFTEHNSDYYFNPLAFYDANYTLINNTDYDIQINNDDGSFYTTYKIGDAIPSVTTTINNRFTEVNLNDYEYVILNLKDYSKKTAFNTNLQVKGMIGITPVYEFGTIEKNPVTDRCNTSYSDFTNYRFSVLKSDLINNAVYYVKACEENSSFKFDSTIFDATYITADTSDNPVITVGGNNYQVLKFNQLKTTANSNEENNFIPGESGSSLTDIVDNASSFTSDMWNAISNFMGLVTKFFNTLPEEFRALMLTGFTTLFTIAVIKFIKS